MARFRESVLIEDQDGRLYAVFQPHMLLLHDPDSRYKGSININAAAHVLSLYDGTGSKSTVLLDGKNSEMRLRKKDGKDTFWLDAESANMWLGGNNDADGDILLFPSDASVGDYENVSPTRSTIHLDGGAGYIALREEGKVTIKLDGATGDIILSNADCAEDFEVLDGQDVEPGSVMVIEQEGKLRQSTKAYDKRVAGVISGAGGNKPGIILGRDPSNGKAMPIALSGKVYCKADAGQAPIQVGDLLTTSDIPGYAMKATDPTKAFGAVIGKALRPLDSGQGLIPILVALQ
jgi:hypothetical protein